MRSSRGTLLITTKEPIKEGFQLSFTGRFGVQSALKTPKPLSAYQYAYLLNEALQMTERIRFIHTMTLISFVHILILTHILI